MRKRILIGLLAGLFLYGLCCTSAGARQTFPPYCHMYPAPADRQVDEGTPWLVAGWGGVECSYEISYAWVWTELLMWSRIQKRWIYQGSSPTGHGRPFQHMVATTAYALCRYWGGSNDATKRPWRVKEWADVELANTGGTKYRIGPVDENTWLKCIGEKK